MRPNNYFEYAGTAAVAGNGTIVGTCAANQTYTLFEFQLQLEGTGPQTHYLIGGSAQPRIYCANAGDGILRTFGSNVDDEGLLRMLPGSAIVINASGSAAYNYNVRGFIEPLY